MGHTNVVSQTKAVFGDRFNYIEMQDLLPEISGLSWHSWSLKTGFTVYHIWYYRIRMHVNHEWYHTCTFSPSSASILQFMAFDREHQHRGRHVRQVGDRTENTAGLVTQLILVLLLRTLRCGRGELHVGQNVLQGLQRLWWLGSGRLYCLKKLLLFLQNWK